MTSSTLSKTALVLSGGGARGAYQVGVVSGLVEVLGAGGATASPFGLYVGASVGAINASFLAANAHRHDLNIGRLEAVWAQLKLRRMVSTRPIKTLAFWRQVLSARKARKRLVFGTCYHHC